MKESKFNHNFTTWHGNVFNYSFKRYVKFYRKKIFRQLIFPHFYSMLFQSLIPYKLKHKTI